jgi:hypothetical protein
MTCGLEQLDPHGGAQQRAALAAHLRACDLCRGARRDDRRLARLTRAADSASAPADLWPRLELALARERAPARAARRIRISLAAAAVLTVVGAWYALSPRPETSSLLAGAEAQAVASEEQQLRAEVARLEAQATRLEPSARAASLRAQIQYVAANLEWCEAAVQQNALNRSVRRSLLAGYRLKSELLRELLSKRS